MGPGSSLRKGNCNYKILRRSLQIMWLFHYEPCFKCKIPDNSCSWYYCKLREDINHFININQIQNILLLTCLHLFINWGNTFRENIFHLLHISDKVNTTLMWVKNTTCMRVKNTTRMRVKNTTRMRVKNTTRNGTESR